MVRPVLLVAAGLAIAGWSCGSGTDADAFGVGAECSINDDCYQDEDFEQRCLTRFAGGYCGLTDCLDDLDCPGGSACISHTDGVNYCFRICDHKPECNRNRSLEVEANCSANVNFVEGAQGRKACVPPSSGS